MASETPVVALGTRVPCHILFGYVPERLPSRWLTGSTFTPLLLEDTVPCWYYFSRDRSARYGAGVVDQPTRLVGSSTLLEAVVRFYLMRHTLTTSQSYSCMGDRLRLHAKVYESFACTYGHNASDVPVAPKAA